MTTALLKRPTLALACLLTIGSAACQDDFESPIEPQLGVVKGNGGQPNAFEVYTQNMYLGGDTGPLFSIDFSNLPVLLAATGQFWSEVETSDVHERVVEFVNEIDERRPHVVSLQEVLHFMLLDGAGQLTREVDLLAEIENEMANRDLPYTTAIVQAGTSSTLPLGFDPLVGVTQWLKFTDRLVVLKRSDVPVLESEQGLYGAKLPLGPLEMVRAWARLTVDHDGTPHHFVATHLEIQASGPVHAAQAYELQNSILADLDGVTILAGDLNSDAAAHEGAPSWTETYDNLMAAGFTDVWEASPARRGALGVTCCQDPSLRADSELDQRIDFVLTRSSGDAGGDLSQRRGLFRVEIVGDEASDRTSDGLWPSDHAGIAATIRIPKSLRTLPR
jgi:endonuclease/exonuclease/phosphatase family metal-dependent hydrolase